MASLTPDMKRPLAHHLHPDLGRVHRTSGFACWCAPHLYRLCTQCRHDPACWACEGDGVIRVDRAEPGDRMLVVHHYVADDEPIVRA